MTVVQVFATAAITCVAITIYGGSFLYLSMITSFSMNVTASNAKVIRNFDFEAETIETKDIMDITKLQNALFEVKNILQTESVQKLLPLIKQFADEETFKIAIVDVKRSINIETLRNELHEIQYVATENLFKQTFDTDSLLKTFDIVNTLSNFIFDDKTRIGDSMDDLVISSESENSQNVTEIHENGIDITTMQKALFGVKDIIQVESVQKVLPLVRRFTDDDSFKKAVADVKKSIDIENLQKELAEIKIIASEESLKQTFDTESLVKALDLVKSLSSFLYEGQENFRNSLVIFQGETLFDENTKTESSIDIKSLHKALADIKSIVHIESIQKVLPLVRRFTDDDSFKKAVAEIKRSVNIDDLTKELTELNMIVSEDSLNQSFDTESLSKTVDIMKTLSSYLAESHNSVSYSLVHMSSVNDLRNKKIGPTKSINIKALQTTLYDIKDMVQTSSIQKMLPLGKNLMNEESIKKAINEVKVSMNMELNDLKIISKEVLSQESIDFESLAMSVDLTQALSTYLIERTFIEAVQQSMNFIKTVQRPYFSGDIIPYDFVQLTHLKNSLNAMEQITQINLLQSALVVYDNFQKAVVVVNQLEKALVVIDDPQKALVVFKDYETALVVIDELQKSLVVVDKLQRALVVVNEFQKALVVIDEFQKALVLVSNTEKALVLIDEFQKALVVIDNYQKALVVVDEFQKALVLVDDLQKALVVIDTLNNLQKALVVVDDLQKALVIVDNFAKALVKVNEFPNDFIAINELEKALVLVDNLQKSLVVIDNLQKALVIVDNIQKELIVGDDLTKALVVVTDLQKALINVSSIDIQSIPPAVDFDLQNALVFIESALRNQHTGVVDVELQVALRIIEKFLSKEFQKELIVVDHLQKALVEVQPIIVLSNNLTETSINHQLIKKEEYNKKTLDLKALRKVMDEVKRILDKNDADKAIYANHQSIENLFTSKILSLEQQILAASINYSDTNKTSIQHTEPLSFAWKSFVYSFLFCTFMLISYISLFSIQGKEKSTKNLQELQNNSNNNNESNETLSDTPPSDAAKHIILSAITEEKESDLTEHDDVDENNNIATSLDKRFAKVGYMNENIIIIRETDDVTINTNVNSRIAPNCCVKLVLGRVKDGRHVLRLDNFSVYITPEMKLQLSPSRKMFYMEKQTPFPLGHNNTIVLCSEISGSSISLQFNNEKTFFTWHKCLRETLADLILNPILDQKCSSLISTEELVSAINSCKPFIDDDYPALKRVIGLWWTKVKITDMMDRIQSTPGKVPKSAIKNVFQSIVESSSDSLLKGDATCLDFVKFATDILSPQNPLFESNDDLPLLVPNEKVSNSETTVTERIVIAKGKEENKDNISKNEDKENSRMNTSSKQLTNIVSVNSSRSSVLQPISPIRKKTTLKKSLIFSPAIVRSTHTSSCSTPLVPVITSSCQKYDEMFENILQSIKKNKLNQDNSNVDVTTIQQEDDGKPKVNTNDDIKIQQENNTSSDKIHDDNSDDNDDNDNDVSGELIESARKMIEAYELQQAEPIGSPAPLNPPLSLSRQTINTISDMTSLPLAEIISPDNKLIGDKTAKMSHTKNLSHKKAKNSPSFSSSSSLNQSNEMMSPHSKMNYFLQELEQLHKETRKKVKELELINNQHAITSLKSSKSMQTSYPMLLKFILVFVLGLLFCLCAIASTNSFFWYGQPLPRHNSTNLNSSPVLTSLDTKNPENRPPKQSDSIMGKLLNKISIKFESGANIADKSQIRLPDKNNINDDPVSIITKTVTISAITSSKANDDETDNLTKENKKNPVHRTVINIKNNVGQNFKKLFDFVLKRNKAERKE